MATWSGMLDEVMRERGTRLLAYATFLIGPAAAEDLVQDALIRSFTRERSFPHVNAAEAYVRRTIATMSIDAFRRRSTRVKGEQRIAVGNRVSEVATTRDTETPLDVRAALAVGTVKRYLHDATERLERLLGPGVLGSDKDGLCDGEHERITVVDTKIVHAERGTK